MNEQEVSEAMSRVSPAASAAVIGKLKAAGDVLRAGWRVD